MVPSFEDVHFVPSFEDVHLVPSFEDVHLVPSFEDVHLVPSFEDVHLVPSFDQLTKFTIIERRLLAKISPIFHGCLKKVIFAHALPEDV